MRLGQDDALDSHIFKTLAVKQDTSGNYISKPPAAKSFRHMQSWFFFLTHYVWKMAEEIGYTHEQVVMVAFLAASCVVVNRDDGTVIGAPLSSNHTCS